MYDSAADKKKRDAAVKAVQVAFEMEQQIAGRVRILAAESGLSPSDQIRKMIGLSYSRPLRPRLTVRLNIEDYAVLAGRYGLSCDDTLAIRKCISEELKDRCEPDV